MTDSERDMVCCETALEMIADRKKLVRYPRYSWSSTITPPLCFEVSRK